jgi:hypothetical protein
VSPSFDHLLPEQQFQLYGVSTRFPRKLASQIDFQRIQQGVYDVVWGTDKVRIIVLSQISGADCNAIWRLFSADSTAVIQAKQQYQAHLSNMSSVINQLFEYYQKEKVIMSYTMQDFQKDYIRDHLDLLSADEVLKRYSSDEVLKRYSLDERLKGLSFDEIFKHFSPDEIKAWLEKCNKNSGLAS